ncbi:hypothetical protein ATG71_1092 [Bacillus sp. es.034]|nr:hypothetical protein ATG71_1092 [Bacillus sp. es.034]
MKIVVIFLQLLRLSSKYCEKGFTLKLFHKGTNTKLILLKTVSLENMQEDLFFVRISTYSKKTGKL